MSPGQTPAHRLSGGDRVAQGDGHPGNEDATKDRSPFVEAMTAFGVLQPMRVTDRQSTEQADADLAEQGLEMGYPAFNKGGWANAAISKKD